MTISIVIPTRERLSQASTATELVTPTPERLRHANDNFAVTGQTTRMHDAPIDRLLRGGQITNQQHAAAESYYADWYAAGMAPLGAVDYSRVLVDGSKPSSVSDYRMAASERFNRARKDLGAGLGVVVDSVVLHEQGLFVAGRMAGGTTRMASALARGRLRDGLDVLAMRYGLVKKNAHFAR